MTIKPSQCLQYISKICGVALITLNFISLAQGGLAIESETKEYSADLNLKEEENGPLAENEKKEDKKRTTIGVGEVVTLRIVGNEKVMPDFSKVQWSFKKGNDLAVIATTTQGINEVELIVNKDIKKNGVVEIEAITENAVLTINFNIVVPKGIIAKHLRQSYDRTDKKFNERGVPMFNHDGNELIASASAFLELTVIPTNVSFSNIQLIERDKGTVPKPNPGVNLASVHNTMAKPLSLDPQNRLADRIATTIMIASLEDYPLPQEWTWICEWNVSDGVKDVFTITTVNQNFSYDYFNVITGIIITTVSKFERSVERTTEEGNKHIFR